MLLDLKLSAGSEFEGLTLCAKLSAAYPDLGLLVLTTFLAESYKQERAAENLDDEVTGTMMAG